MINDTCSVEVTRILAIFMAELPKKMNHSVRTISEVTGINLYKYGKGKIFPLTSSLLSYCKALDIDPGLMIYLACQVSKGDLAEVNAIGILASSKHHRRALDFAYQMVIRDIHSEYPNTLIQSTVPSIYPVQQPDSI
jgi:hypothetical protein